MKNSIIVMIVAWISLFGLGLSCASAAGSQSDQGTSEPSTEDVRPSPDNSRYFNSFTFYLENDFFAGTDRDYTNGVKMTWSTAYGDLSSESLPKWSSPLFHWLPFVNQSGGKHSLSLAFGQDIYTPRDTATAEQILDDRPYAGRLYVAAGFHARRAQRKDTWEISIGMVGPASLAQETQDLIHDIIGSEKAAGWDNQINNELTIDAICESQWRYRSATSTSGFNVDLIPHLGGRVGTVMTYLNTGAEMRMGWQLPNNFGSCQPMQAVERMIPCMKTGGPRTISICFFQPMLKPSRVTFFWTETPSPAATASTKKLSSLNSWEALCGSSVRPKRPIPMSIGPSSLTHKLMISFLVLSA